MSEKKVKEYAARNGFYPLGSQEVEVQIPLSESEKVELGKGQSESLCEIDRLEAEFAKVKQDYKAKIDTHQVIIRKTSVVIRRGHKIEKKELPAFLDPKQNQKVWVDLNTGEIIERAAATEYDRQGALID